MHLSHTIEERKMLTKRLAKFLLKRLLGKYIVCDLDLDQLDVEVRSGIIHLKDIDLDVEVWPLSKWGILSEVKA